MKTLYGFSVFLDKEISEKTVSYIKKLASIGFTGIFTSIHIPEDDSSKYLDRLKRLGCLAKNQKLQLMVDMSGNALESIGASFDRLIELKTYGITGLRMDFAVSNEQISQASQDFTISLNASTVTEEDISELHRFHANFENLEVWHNYYPRPETGLSKETLLRKNEFLRDNGLSIQAFVAGDENLRQPLKLGLPTLEAHRGKHPLAAAIELSRFGLNQIYIGDGGLKERTISQFDDYLNRDCMTLLAENNDSAYFSLVLKEHQNRADPARDVIRSKEARFGRIAEIQPEYCIKRKKGAVTIDNRLYGRYMGEMQITLRDLPADEKVNVVGFVAEKDIDLLDEIGPDQKYKIIGRG
ncbi:DUF871 domain-containing protein [Lactovum odontotermitis]